MLIIGGVQITDIDDEILSSQFGYSYQRGERIGNILAGYLEDDPFPNNFSDICSFVDYITSHNRRRAPLIRMYLHKQYAGPYKIVMQGSRQGDYDKANIAADLKKTPKDYTWHHAEKIIPVGYLHYECFMYLIESWYHNGNKHSGAVHEYELLTGLKYKR